MNAMSYVTQESEWLTIRDELIAQGKEPTAHDVTQEQQRRAWARGERLATLPEIEAELVASQVLEVFVQWDEFEALTSSSMFQSWCDNKRMIERILGSEVAEQIATFCGTVMLVPRTTMPDVRTNRRTLSAD